MYKQIPIKSLLYYGTVTPFSQINLNKGRNFKDFGKGFYLAYLKKQSINIANKYRQNNKGTPVVYTYEVIQSEYENLWYAGRVKYFNCADYEWLDFILKSRTTRGIWHNYDIVIGPTADDNTYLVFNNYFEGTYGDPFSLRAKDILLYNLETANLGTQVFIATQEGLKILNQKTRKVEKL